MKNLALALSLAAAGASCQSCAHVNPGQVVLACGMDAAKDPRVIQAVVDALHSANWEAALAAVIAGLGPVGEEVVVCIVDSLLASPAVSADPAMISHGRAFLQQHGYVVK